MVVVVGEGLGRLTLVLFRGLAVDAFVVLARAVGLRPLCPFVLRVGPCRLGDDTVVVGAVGFVRRLAVDRLDVSVVVC